jgi:hypothetical protein
VSYTYVNAKGESFDGVYDFKWDHVTNECTAFFVCLTKRGQSPTSAAGLPSLHRRR